MLALIKREIRDHIVYFIAAAICSAIFIAMGLETVHEYNPRNPPVFPIGIGISLAAIVTAGICAMGATQMYFDKTRRVSALLSTRPVSRSMILLARIIAGLLAILTLLAPIAVATTILLRLFTPPIPMYSGLVWEIFTATFLLAFACYCIGLQTGWNTNALTPTLGALGLTCIFVPLILIKGPGLQIVVILQLFITASLVRTWNKFLSTPL